VQRKSIVRSRPIRVIVISRSTIIGGIAKTALKPTMKMYCRSCFSSLIVWWN